MKLKTVESLSSPVSKKIWLMLLISIGMLLSLRTATAAEDAPRGLAGVRRVVFLGDSITYSGQYIDFIDAYVRVRYPGATCEFLNLGLPSETCSGLSEPGHAGGKFPRPDVHERLERVLAQTKPDLVVACYGMNCGIYHPFSEARLEKYAEGQRFLHERAAAIGAKILHVTPPTFDPLPIQARTLPAGLAEYRQPYVGYNDVLGRYSHWLLEQQSAGWDVVDVHGPMDRYLLNRRQRDPSFRLAGDGVHTDATGHWLIAQHILLHWGAPADEITQATSGEQLLSAYPHGSEVRKLVTERQRLLRDAWLSATGHKRPGMKAGLPLAEAEPKAAALDAKIRGLLPATK
jgi:lysophospholipase L1-like esterase